MSANAPAREPLEILIVEDNHDARTTMRMLLSLGQGHVVHEASDGASGVRAALELRPHVALIDLGLPDLDGFEVARRIRVELDSAAIMLIALTGYGSPEDRRRTREAGFDMHLLKPVDTVELASILDSIAR